MFHDRYTTKWVEWALTWMSLAAASSFTIAATDVGSAGSASESTPGPTRVWTMQDGPQVPSDASLRSGTLSFTGHATIGAFVGTTTVVHGAVHTDAGIESARGWVEAPVATLRTGNDHRDRDMYASMELDRFPTIRFDLTGVGLEPTGARPDSARGNLNGRLTIHAVSRDVSIPATLVFIGDAIDVAGEFPLDLADYRIGGLTRFFGALRMQRNIEVSLRLRFQSTQHASAGERDVRRRPTRYHAHN